MSATHIRQPAKSLTAASVAKLKAVDGNATTYPDKELPGLELRVGRPDANGTSNKSYSILVRVAGDPTKIRISIGDAETVSLAKAREMAREYRLQAKAGTDPRQEKRERVEAAERERMTTVEAVAEEFIAKHVATLKSRKKTEAEIRRHIIGPWEKRAIASLTARDIAKRIEDVKEETGGPAAASRVFAHISKLFNWAAAPPREYVTTKPHDRLVKKELGIKIPQRLHVLTDDELRLVWKAIDRAVLPASVKPCLKMLILSGQRVNEIARLSWSEVDPKEKTILVPAHRMKKGREHLVPLSPAMYEVLSSLPRGEHGDFVFSTLGGKKPVAISTKVRAKLNKAIAELRQEEAEEASRRGDKAHRPPMEPWMLHDLRRTVRTGLGAIPTIRHDVAELVVAHIPAPLVQNYNRHLYIEEKREALTLWSRRLSGIIDPPNNESEIVRLRTAATA